MTNDVKERLVFRPKTRAEDSTPHLAILKERFPEMTWSEIMRYCLKVTAEA